MRTVMAPALLAFMIVLTDGVAEERFDPERFGIGVEIVREDSSSAIWVKSCLKHGPADRAGIKPGDVLLELDGSDISRWSFLQVVRYLTREQPLPVRVTYRRESSVLSVVLTRERFTDMGKRAGVRYRMSPDSASYLAVPIEELPPATIGEVVDFGGLRDLSCKQVTPSAASGKPTLVYFWATWCAPCKTLIAKLNDEGVDRSSRLIGINLDNDCEAFRTNAIVSRAPGEQFWAGWDGNLPQVLGVHRRGVPTGAVLDQDGRLLGSALGVDSVLTLFRESTR